MTYGKYVSDPTPSQAPEMPLDANDINDYANNQNNDDDGDGIPNSWDDVSGGLDDIAGQVSDSIDSFTCNGGCLPIPINMALLAPGPINVMGMPAGFDPGTPIFSYPPATLFLYLSPTLTGNLANSVCVAGNCWSIIIPLLPPSACQAITKAITDAMSNATNFVSSGGSSTMALSGGGGTGNK